MSDYREEQPTAEDLDAMYGDLLPDGASFKEEFYYKVTPEPDVKTAEEYAAMPIEEQLRVVKEELLWMYNQHGCSGNTEIADWLDNESST